MPNIKFGRKLIINPTKVEVEKEKDDIEVLEYVKVKEASPKVVIKEEVKKISLTYGQSRKKIRKVEQVTSNNDDCHDKQVEEKVAEYLEVLKKQMMGAMFEREEKVIKVIKMKDIQLSKMRFNQECLELEWSEKAELLKKEATVKEEIIKKLEKKNEELTKEQDHREQTLMKLRDQISQLSLENEEFKQKSDQTDSLRAEIEASHEEREKQAKRLQTLQTELESSQQQWRKKAEENKQIVQDSARQAEEHRKKFNQELKEKEGLLEEWKRKADEKDLELSKVQEQLHTEKNNYAKDLERKDRIHKKEMKSRVEQSNKTIEELRKQLDKQVGLRELEKKKEEILRELEKEKVLTGNESEEGLERDYIPKYIEREVIENQHEVEKQTAVDSPRDPRIRNKGQLRRRSDEAKNVGNLDLKTKDSFFSPRGVGDQKYNLDNPFDQRPFHAKRKEYERHTERKEEVIRKLPSEKWKYERELPWHNYRYYHHRGRPAHQDYHRTWSQ